MRQMLHSRQFGGAAFDVLHDVAAFEQVVGGDAFAVFDHVGNFAAPEGTGNMGAEERVLRGDLISPAFGLDIFGVWRFDPAELRFRTSTGYRTRLK